MDRAFMKDFYKNSYGYPQEIALKDSEEYIGKRKLRYAKAFPSIKLGGRYYVDEVKLQEFLDCYAHREFVM